MNQVGHHSIIAAFVERNQIDDDKRIILNRILEDASDFTDSSTEYFYYHFIYDITCSKSNVVKLERVNEKKKFEYSSRVEPKLPTTLWEKDFFALINGREKSTLIDAVILGNQDDNVSFLHAMGAKGEEGTINIFKWHLERCFYEYLFLRDERDALFMLGIAFHGIMDSFTSSHTDFQKYTKQNMALHAQGDVIPFKNGEDRTLYFDPGQVSHKDASKSEVNVGKWLKGFDKDNYLNPVEKAMLFLYLYLGDIRLKNNNPKKTLSAEEIAHLIDNRLSSMSISEINETLNRTYEYGDNAFMFSENTLDVLSEIWECLTAYRKKMNGSKYELYKSKETKQIVNKAIGIWENKYNSFISELSMNNKLAILKEWYSYSNSKLQILQGIGALEITLANKASKAISDTVQSVGDFIVDTAQAVGGFFGDTE